MVKLGWYLLAVLLATAGIPCLLYTVGFLVVLILDGKLMLSGWQLVTGPAFVGLMLCVFMALSRVGSIDHKGFLPLVFSTYSWAMALLILSLSVAHSLSHGYNWWWPGYWHDRLTLTIMALIATGMLVWWRVRCRIPLPPVVLRGEAEDHLS